MVKINIKLFSANCQFAYGVNNEKAFPKTRMPEFAFIGRSNVGKSSLVNALVNRKNLVKVSQSPGCTRQVNYFDLAEVLYLVDLPGYGYAKLSKQEKQNLSELIGYYFVNSRHLKRVFLLLDARHPPKEWDYEMMDFFDEHGVPYQIVLTKVDQVPKSFDISGIQATASSRPACIEEIVLTSSEKKQGIDKLRQVILSLL
jgi:GTP-binding protein